MASLSSLHSLKPTHKLILIILVLIVASLAQFLGNPYQDNFLNLAEMGSLFVLNFVFASTLVFRTSPEGLFAEVLAYFVTILVVVYGGFLFCSGAAIKLSKICRACLNRKRGGASSGNGPGKAKKATTVLVHVEKKSSRNQESRSKTIKPQLQSGDIQVVLFEK